MTWQKRDYPLGGGVVNGHPDVLVQVLGDSGCRVSELVTDHLRLQSRLEGERRRGVQQIAHQSAAVFRPIGGFRPGGQLVTPQQLLAGISAPFNPLAGIDLAGANLGVQQTRTGQARALVGLRRAQIANLRGVRTEFAAEQNFERQEDRVAAARKKLREAQEKTGPDGKKKDPKKQAAEQKAAPAALRLEVERLRDRYALLQKAKKNQQVASGNLTKAEAAYKAAVDKAQAAAEKQRETLEKLQAQREAAVQLGESVAQQQLQGTGIVELFGGSLTAEGLLADLQAKAAATRAFGGQLTALRKAGLSEALVTQIQSAGAEAGSEIAQAILDAGGGYVAQLNAAQNQLQAQANLIDAQAANAVYSAVIPNRPGGRPTVAQLGAKDAIRPGQFSTSLFAAGGVRPVGTSGGTGRGVEFTQNNYGVQDPDILARRAVAQLTFAGSAA